MGTQASTASAQRGEAQRTVPGLLRTFFAVEIGDAARREASAVADRLAASPGGAAVRWARPEAYHVTLRFLGKTRRASIAPLIAGAREATRAIPAFPARLGALGGFPERRPRVVVIGVCPEAPLIALAQAIEAAVVAEGFEPDARGYHPHLTLGRVKDRAKRAPILHAKAGPADPAPFDVASFTLFQSVLTPSGSQYTALERIPLEAPA
jgi:2'-5' RNA ligase